MRGPANLFARPYEFGARSAQVTSARIEEADRLTACFHSDDKRYPDTIVNHD
jgi:hypothetical protein